MNKLDAQITANRFNDKLNKIQSVLGNTENSNFVPLIMSEKNFVKLFSISYKDGVSKSFRTQLADGVDVGGSISANGRIRKIATPDFGKDKSNADLVWIGFEKHECNSHYDRPRIEHFTIEQKSPHVKNAVVIQGETADSISKIQLMATLDNSAIEVAPTVFVASKRGTKVGSKKTKKVVTVTPQAVNDSAVVLNTLVSGSSVNKPEVGLDYQLPVIENVDGYHFPDFADEIADSILFGEHTYIFGPAGCGKSTMARLLCRMMGKEPYEVDFSSGVDEATFIGTKEATVDENGNAITTFQYGLFPKALKEGRPIIVNEIDMGQPQYLAALHGILEENDPKLVILDNGAEVITPEPGFVLIATGNTAGTGEDVGDYSGTNILNKAFLDRFAAFFELGYTKEEMKIVKNILIRGKKHLASKVMAFVRDIRKLKDTEIIDSLFSTRRIIMLSEKINRWGVKRAIQRTILDRLEKDEREVWNEVVQRHFPQDFDESEEILEEEKEEESADQNIGSVSNPSTSSVKLPF